MNLFHGDLSIKEVWVKGLTGLSSGLAAVLTARLEHVLLWLQVVGAALAIIVSILMALSLGVKLLKEFRRVKRH